MHLYLVIIAWIVIVSNVVAVALQPALFGTERTQKKYSYATWITSIIEAILIIPLALHALGYL